MAKESNVAFRSSLNGYNREDVNRSILQMNRAAEDRERTLIAERKTVQMACDVAEARAAEAQQSLASAEKIQASLRETIDTLKEQMETLKEENDALRHTCESLSASLSEKEATASATAPAQAETAQKYEQLSAQIGDIMIRATTAADEIIANANAEAARILTDTETEAIYVHTRLAGATDEMLSGISALLHESTDNCIREWILTLREMRDSTASMLHTFEQKSNELGQRINYYHANVNETVREALNEMDSKYGIRTVPKSEAASHDNR